MLLCEQQVALGEILDAQSGVDIALEGEQGLLGILRCEVSRPTAVARDVQGGQLVGKVHEFADLRWRVIAQQVDQQLRVLQVLRLSEAFGY